MRFNLREGREVRGGWALAWMICCVMVDSAAADAPGEPWTRERVVEEALRSSPRIREAEALVEAAGALGAHSDVPAVGNPVVTLRAMVGFPDAPAATYAGFVGLPFDVSGRRGTWRREATAAVEEAEAMLAVVTNEVRAEALAAYVELAASHALVELADARFANAEQWLSRVRARADVRASSALDVAMAESELGVSAEARAVARRQKTSAAARLRAALGLDAVQDVAVVALAERPELGDAPWTTFATRAVERRSEVRMHAAAARRSEASASRARAEAIELPIVGLEYEAQGNRNTQSTMGASASFTLPFVRRAQGEQAVANAEARVASARGEIAAEGIAREVRATYERVESALAELDALETQALPAAERALSLTEELITSGAADYFRLLVAWRDVYALRGRKIDALREAWLARAELDRAAGGR